MHSIRSCRATAAFSFVTAAVLAQGPTPNPGNALVSPQAVVAQKIQVAPGQLTGKALTTGARQPIGFHSMQLLDEAGKPIAKVVTDTNGIYRTPNLDPGRYMLQVRPNLVMELQATPGAQLTNLDILVPPPSAAPVKEGPQAQNPTQVPAAPGGAAPAAAPAGAAAAAAPAPVAAGLGVGGWALIGAGAAGAVALPVAALNRRNEKAASPVGQPQNN